MRIIKRKEILVLLFILLIALFFRTYQVIERLEWAHDADLYSWIVRDIVVQKHPRLIGQLTTAPGIFIGPAFYYMLVPFFLINNMQPYSGVIPITILGMFNVLSYYYVFNKLFDKKVGLIAAFLTAVLLTSVSFDRWVVPSTPTSLWIVWYFYAVVNLAQGNKRAWPILGFLTGLIWHIHIALAPTLIVIPVAIYLSKKVPKTKDVAVALIAFLIPSIPLILFEVRHGFQQTIGLVNNFTGDHGAGSGIEKLYKVVIMISRNVNSLLFFPQGINNDISRVALVVFLLFLGILLAKKRLIDKKILIISYVWFFAVVAFLSGSPPATPTKIYPINSTFGGFSFA